jgi:CheY-like chemotaxis protein
VPAEQDFSAVVLELRPAPALPDVLIDPGALDQVLLNIAANARDAMPQRGRFTIATAAVAGQDGSAGWVEVALTDTGRGMSPEVAARIFEPFYTTKGGEGGTGLGLASAYGIVTQAGGTIAVESAPGVGTTFRLRLPALPAAHLSAPAPATPQAADRGVAARGETILLVEDEDAIRRLAARFLQQLGYRVLSARRGLEAVAVAAGHRGVIHLVVTDIRMPELTGPELVERLRMARPGLPALFMSGYINAPVVRRGGVNPHEEGILAKPFTLDQLGERVRAVLDAAAPTVPPGAAAPS